MVIFSHNSSRTDFDYFSSNRKSSICTEFHLGFRKLFSDFLGVFAVFSIIRVFLCGCLWRIFRLIFGANGLGVMIFRVISFSFTWTFFVLFIPAGFDWIMPFSYLSLFFIDLFGIFSYGCQYLIVAFPFLPLTSFI